MLKTNLEQIGLSDLEELVSNEVSEGKRIEYKRDFYRLDANDADYKTKQHKEMLKDISSFANSLGGDLIIGIDEADGVASSVCGFDVSTGVDGLKRRILDIVLSGLEPRLALDIHSVPNSENNAVFIVRVPASPIAPHRVVYRNEFGQFWARSSGGAFRMDTFDLRQSFVDSANLKEQVIGFKAERIRLVCAGETPVNLEPGAKLVLHLFPTDSFSSQVSLTPHEIQGQMVNFPLLHSTGGWSNVSNADGLLLFDSADPKSGYVQVFRNGVIESVVVGTTTHFPNDPEKRPVFKHEYVRDIVLRLPNYLKAYAALDIRGPVACCISLIGINGMTIYNPGIPRARNPVDRDVLELPSVEFSTLAGADCAEVLRPTFDYLWNAAGQIRCLLYEPDGRFKGQF